MTPRDKKDIKPFENPHKNFSRNISIENHFSKDKKKKIKNSLCIKLKSSRNCKIQFNSNYKLKKKTSKAKNNKLQKKNSKKSMKKPPKITSTTMLKKKYKNIRSINIQKTIKSKKSITKPIFKTQLIKSNKLMDKKFKTNDKKFYNCMVKNKSISKNEEYLSNTNKLSKDESLSSTLKSMNLKERLNKANDRKQRKKNITSPSSIKNSKIGSPKNLYNPLYRKKNSNFSPKVFKKIPNDTFKEVKQIEINEFKSTDSKQNICSIKNKSLSKKEILKKNQKSLNKMDKSIFKEFKDFKKNFEIFELERSKKQMAQSDLESRISQKDVLSNSTELSKYNINKLGKCLKFFNEINEIYENLHKKSQKTKIINMNKHKLLSEKNANSKRILEVRNNINSINNHMEEYKKRIQKIFEDHTKIIDRLLKDKKSFGIQSSKKISIDKMFKSKKVLSPKLKNKNNFYEDSFSENLSHEESSFECDNAFKSFSKRKNSEKNCFNSFDTVNENIYSPKFSPSEEKMKLNLEISSYDSSINQMIQRNQSSSNPGNYFFFFKLQIPKQN
jgi:hypothetical protein